MKRIINYFKRTRFITVRRDHNNEEFTVSTLDALYWVQRVTNEKLYIVRVKGFRIDYTELVAMNQGHVGITNKNTLWITFDEFQNEPAETLKRWGKRTGVDVHRFDTSLNMHEIHQFYQGNQ